MTALRCTIALAPALFVACAARGPVMRVVDGESAEGRPIAAAAYAAYLRASVLEERGDLRGAVAEFERALDEDSGSPEVVTRIASILCRSAGASPEAANEALGNFDDALVLDPTYAPAWLGLAECRERRRELRAAHAAAERAVYYDPTNTVATRTAARLSFALGRPDEGFAWLEGLVALVPTSREAFEAYRDAAVEHRDAVREARARRALAELGVTDERSRSAALDEALRAGDLPRARAIAVALSVGPSALAWRALEISSHAVALEQAELVLAADPSDSNAWVAALVAADALGEQARFVEALRELDPEPLAPSPVARDALAKLIARHAGAEAAAAFARAQRKP